MVDLGTYQGFFDADRATILERQAMEDALAAEAARGRVIDAAWAAYNSDFAPPLPPANDGVDDTVTTNVVKRVVDTTTEYLFGLGLGLNLPVGTEAPETETPDEVFLDAMLEANQFGVFLGDARTNGGVGGTAYAKLLPPDPARTGHPYPRVQVLNPSIMSLRTDPRDVDYVLSYVCQFRATDPDTGKPIIVRQTTKRLGTGWVIVDEHATLDGPNRWILDKTTVWAKPYPPIVHCKNARRPNDCYGDPDLTDNLIDLNEALNFNLTNRNRVDHYQGHPILYSVGLGRGGLDIRPDRFNHLPGENAKLDQLAPNIKAEAAEQLAHEIRNALYEESATPPITQGQSEDGNPSGVALRVKFWPMLSKILMMRLFYGPFIVEIIRRLFDLAGKGPDKRVTLDWPDIIPGDKLAEAQVLLIYVQAGVMSRATFAARVGLKWEDELKNLQAEAALAPAPVAAQPQANLGTKADTARGGK